jgi:hypothetical protein
MENLTSLTFAFSTKVSDAGLALISSLSALSFLDLSGSKYAGSTPSISDAGLRHLIKLEKLKTLNLESCHGVSKAGKEYLKKALPQCTIK